MTFNSNPRWNPSRCCRSSPAPASHALHQLRPRLIPLRYLILHFPEIPLPHHYPRPPYRIFSSVAAGQHRGLQPRLLFPATTMAVRQLRPRSKSAPVSWMPPCSSEPIPASVRVDCCVSIKTLSPASCLIETPLPIGPCVASCSNANQRTSPICPRRPPAPPLAPPHHLRHRSSDDFFCRLSTKCRHPCAQHRLLRRLPQRSPAPQPHREAADFDLTDTHPKENI